MKYSKVTSDNNQLMAFDNLFDNHQLLILNTMHNFVIKLMNTALKMILVKFWRKTSHLRSVNSSSLYTNNQAFYVIISISLCYVWNKYNIPLILSDIHILVKQRKNHTVKIEAFQGSLIFKGDHLLNIVTNFRRVPLSLRSLLLGSYWVL